MSSASTILPPEKKRKAYGLIFGVENYLEDGLEDVRYAERDATEVRNALLKIGYEGDDIELIVNSSATKTTIEYETTQLAKTAQRGDTVFFFFAGHGYTWEAQNYLLAYDTRRGAIVDTAVSLRKLFDLFSESECRQVMFFLDCCHSGMRLADEARGVLEEMSAEELNKYFQEADFCVVFSSCDKGEYSYPSLKYKHGFWTYHLLKALRGEEPQLLDDERRLRSTSLQDFLRDEVPTQLALQSTKKRNQSPKMFGDVSGTFEIADLTLVMETVEAERKAQSTGLKHSTLRACRVGSVSDLNGFNKGKGHTLPKFQSDRTRSWVASLADEEMEVEMEEYFDAVRKSKQYKNNVLEYDEPSEGGAAIRTPDFEFIVYYCQSEDDPGDYEVVRELSQLNNPDLLQAQWFNEMFRRVFDEAVFEFSGQIDIREFIDQAEDVEALEIDFDGKRSHCSISMDGFDGTITVREKSITYEFSRAETPEEMALELLEAHALLLGMPNMQRALPLWNTIS